MIQRNNLSRLKPRRKALRNDSTPAELLLWCYLKCGQLDGRKFRRQHSYGPFIMDFYCPSERLCIELDGPTHDSNDERVRDDMRTEFLNKHLIKVLRFKNEEVYQSVEKVLTRIREVRQH